MNAADRQMAIGAALLAQRGRFRSLSSGDIERMAMFILEVRDTQRRRDSLKTDVDVDRYAAELDEADAREMLASLIKDVGRLMKAIKAAGRLPAPGEDAFDLAIELIGRLDP